MSNAAYKALERGKACNNCRRRKIKCDGVRPTCSQCRVRPPRSNIPCEFELEPIKSHQTPAQLLETIQILQNTRGHTAAHDRSNHAWGPPSPTLLVRWGMQWQWLLISRPFYTVANPPNSFHSGNAFSAAFGRLTLAQEPALHVVGTLVDTFLEAFTSRGYFFLEPHNFRTSALLPLPFGHPNRPAPSLLSVTYLWGAVLARAPLSPPYSPDTFLQYAHQNLPRDIAGFELNPRLLLHAIQAQVLLSYYYLHIARPVEGRSHASAAVSLALSAGLHSIAPPHAQKLEAFPEFPLRQTGPLLSPPVDPREASERINSWWSVWVLNNYWVAAHGSGSAIPSGATIDTPWPGSSTSGSTVMRFLNGNEQETFSPVALLAKATTLLERTVAFSAHTTGPPDTSSIASRIQAFYAKLPPLPGNGSKPVIIAYLLADLAIVRLHAPYANAVSTSPNPSRGAVFAAAGRIVANLSGLGMEDIKVEPVVGIISATVATVYINELITLHNELDHRRRAQYQEIELQLRNLMNIMSVNASSSPVTQHCLMNVSMAYAAISRSR
ncbi:hypothetical protein C8F01DRAFT_1370559 [Mycena amicta]|nr:hypothetical protein C8F01DRAFT_1370559 [Mycena amicta]